MGKIYTHHGGKASRHDDIYLRRHKSHDISVKRKEGYQYTRSQEQKQMRMSFGERSRRASAWLEANERQPTPEYTSMQEAYKGYIKKHPDGYMSFWQYLIANLPVRDETMKD